MAFHRQVRPVFSSIVGVLALAATADVVSAQPGGPEPIRPVQAPFAMPALQRPVFPDRSFSITDHGAVGDGHTLNTDAIQKAIDACHRAGGGIVVVPAGRWLTVPFELKSNVNLHLEAGSELVFTDEKKYYFSAETTARLRTIMQRSGDPQGQRPISRPMISAYDCGNIAITGPGKLDGQGLYWWPLNKAWFGRNKNSYPPEAVARTWRGLDPETSPGRPRVIQPFRCRNVLLEGFTVSNSPAWAIHPVACENLVIRRLTIRAARPGPNPDTPNTDGINPDSCRNVLIEYCDIHTGDDSIAIKSGVDEAGRKRGIPSENIVIRDVRGKHFAIGSEMSGGVRNVFIRDCELVNVGAHALHIKTRRGRGGVVENIWVQDISVATATTAVIRVDMEYWTHVDPAPPEPVSERTPRFRNMHFLNVRSVEPSTGAGAIYLNGLPEMPLEDFSFENIRLSSQRGIICNHARGITFKNVDLEARQAPVIALTNSQEISFRNLNFAAPGHPFLVLKGTESRAIQFDATLAARRDEVSLEEGAEADAVRFGPAGPGD